MSSELVSTLCVNSAFSAPAAMSLFTLILTAETQRENAEIRREKSTFILGHYPYMDGSVNGFLK